LPIVWQRLVTAGDTCPRCGSTERHLRNAIAKLADMLKPLNIQPSVEMREIDESAFKSDPAQSNRIWIAGKPLESWLGASAGSSQCCSVCGDAPCRTLELDGTVFEEVPEKMILRAAILAVADIIAPPSR
jgi:hypothetical protein